MKKKIFFLINSLHSRSGAERVACIQANYFVDNFLYDVVILNRDTLKNDVPYFLSEKVKVIKLDGNLKDFYSKTKKILVKNNPDYVLVHNMGKLSLFSIFLNIKSMKFISLEHGAFISRSFFIKKITKLLYRRLHGVVVLTEAEKNIFKKMNTQISKIYNPSPFPILLKNSYNKNRKSVIALGRLHPEKNFIHLIEAWALLGELSCNWNLKIYGNGEEYSKLLSSIELNNLKNVYLMGEVENVQDVYNDAAIYVMSSKNEGLPMVLIEAQTFGLPIVSYNCPHGPAEIIDDNINGLLVENQNIEKLSNAILKVMRDYELREFMSNNALNNAKKFSEVEVFEKWRDIFI